MQLLLSYTCHLLFKFTRVIYKNLSFIYFSNEKNQTAKNVEYSNYFLKLKTIFSKKNKFKNKKILTFII